MEQRGLVVAALFLISMRSVPAADRFMYTLFGVSLIGVGMLSHTGNNVSMDTFGPISDNANGIGELAGEDFPPEARQIMADLDAAGNTTKAITKGVAIGSAVIAAVSLFGAFFIDIANANITASGAITTLKAKRWVAGSLTARSVNTLQATGQTGAGGFAGYERIEYLGEIFPLHAHPRVGNAYRHGRRQPPDIHAEPAAVGHGLLGVDDEVQQDLLQLVHVAANVGQVRGQRLGDHDPVEELLIADQANRAPDHLVDVQGFHDHCPLPGKVQ